jgi:Serine phosphatase RsbU, regulator of sigma subunit
MKKVKHLVIGGIQSKVFNLILITVILIVAAFLVVSEYHSRMLADLAAESAERQQTSITEVTDTVMENVVEKSMTRTTALQAYIADALFDELQARVRMLGDYAGKLFSDPDAYPRMKYEAPDAAKDGHAAAQLILAEGVNGEDPALADRLGLAANLSEMMVALFEASKETNACFIALPEGAFLVTDDRSAAKFDDAGNPIGYDPRTRPWYRLAAEEGGLIFTDVETDAFTGDIGIVCAMPVYADGQLAAVVGADLFLTSMKEYVQTDAENGAFVCVINGDGHVVFSPQDEGVFRVMPSGEAQDLREGGNAALASLVTEAMRENTPLRQVETEDGEYYMTGAPMQTVGWTVLSVCDLKAAHQPTELLLKNYEQIQEETTAAYLISTGHSRATVIILLIAITVLMLAGSLILGKRIVKPLNTITERISEISESNLEFKMEDAYRTGDEVEELATSFVTISHRTVEYLETVKRVTAEKERIGTELALANQIQAAMLPHIVPAFPEREDFDIIGSMDPAKEVGGDFYDYFLVDEDHLCMVIADVSGKGVPAALSMMASKIILQSIAMMGYSPAVILERANETICSNNEAQMFVTAWLGILELSTGKLTAANAGHEYPILKRREGQYELYRDKHGFVLGGMEGIHYTEYEIPMKPGDKLFVYTDGVPEATSAEQELFGTERMLLALNSHPDDAPQETLNHMRESVDRFVLEAEQFDDLTMMSMEFKGKAPKGEAT